MTSLLNSPDGLTVIFGGLTALGTVMLFARTLHAIREEKRPRHR